MSHDVFSKLSDELTMRGAASSANDDSAGESAGVHHLSTVFKLSQSDQIILDSQLSILIGSSQD